MPYMGVLIIHRPETDVSDLIQPHMEDEEGNGWWDRWKLWEDDDGNIDPPPGVPVASYSPRYCCNVVLVEGEEDLEIRDDEMDLIHWNEIVGKIVRKHPDRVLTVVGCHA